MSMTLSSLRHTDGSASLQHTLQKDTQVVRNTLISHLEAASSLRSFCITGLTKFLQALIYLVGEAVKTLFCASDWQKSIKVLAAKFACAREPEQALLGGSAPAEEALLLAYDLYSQKSPSPDKVKRVSQLMSTYFGVETLSDTKVRSNPLLLLDPSLYYEAVQRREGIVLNLEGIHEDLQIFLNGRLPSLKLVLRFWCFYVPKLRGKENELIALLDLDEEKNVLLCGFLRVLTKTKDFQMLSQRPRMASSLLQVLQSAGENAELKEMIFDYIRDAMSTCGDRLSLSFAWIECLGSVYRAEALSEKIQIVRGVCLLELIKGYAEEKLQALYKEGLNRQETDEVGVVINCIYRLKESLELPISLHSILFLADSAVKEADLQEICDKVCQTLDDKTEFLILLGEHPLLQKCLEKEYESHLKSIDDDFFHALEDIEENKESISEQQYLFLINNLMRRKVRMRSMISLSLTLPLLVEKGKMQVKAILYAQSLKMIQDAAEEAIMEAFMKKGLILDERAVHSYYRKRCALILEGRLAAKKVDSVEPDALTVEAVEALPYALSDEGVVQLGSQILHKIATSEAITTILVNHPVWREFISSLDQENASHISTPEELRSATELMLIMLETAS